MAFRFFTIPVRDPAATTIELNGFLRAHKVLAVERRWVDQGADSFWSLCVDYLEHAPAERKSGAGPEARRDQVDYKQILTPDEFAVFLRLRDWRKATAAREAVPVYTIFTNDQLARMVQARATTTAAVQALDGIGEARAAKYAAGVLAVLRSWAKPDEAGGQPVPDGPGPGHPA